MIDKATERRILETANIVEVVSDYVHLTRRGTSYMGLCPFHNERTPSFSVNARGNYCHCFSCGKGGSPVNFIMEKEGVSYPDALRQLARKYGIKIEERELSEEELRERTEREAMMIANEWAMKRMEKDMRDTEEGRDVGLSYLYHRGVTDEAIKAFHLGYAIDKGNYLTDLMLKAGFDLETLRKTGLTGVSQQGREYDKYRGRVIFPIMNTSGKVIAFGGRDLKGGLAKYINSPESNLYTKSNELYGIYQAKSEIVRQKNCYLVEGYLDVIGMWQSGLKNVVASSGTSLTDGQINLIHRFADNITVIYDGDAAGIKAALRGMDMLLLHKMRVKVLLLPDGDDPDSFARKHSPEEFRKYIADHQTDIIRFKTQTLLKGAEDNPQDRAAAINSICRTIACIHDEMERSIYVKDCSILMNVGEDLVSRAVYRHREEIVNQFKRNRQMRQIPTDSAIPDASAPSAQNPTDNPEGSVADDNAPAGRQGENGDSGSGDLQKQIATRENRQREPLEPLERRLLTLAIRYGYLPAFIDADGTETMVAEYICDELEADRLKFTVSSYQKTFGQLMANIDEFDREIDKVYDDAEKEIEMLRKEGIEKIASEGLSFDEIRIREKEMEQELADKRERIIEDFRRYFPGNKLASHHDNTIREVANRLIPEKEVISNLFKNTDKRRTVEDIREEVTRALTELKGEILELHIMDIQDRVAELESKGKIEEIAELQRRLLRLFKMRSQVALSTGDRVLSPRRNIK